MSVSRLLTLFFFLIGPTFAWAVDLQPNDVVAPQPNKNYLTLSYLNSENSTFYRNGTVAPGNPVIDS